MLLSFRLLLFRERRKHIKQLLAMRGTRLSCTINMSQFDLVLTYI